MAKVLYTFSIFEPLDKDMVLRKHGNSITNQKGYQNLFVTINYELIIYIRLYSAHLLIEWDHFEPNLKPITSCLHTVQSFLQPIAMHLSNIFACWSDMLNT